MFQDLSVMNLLGVAPSLGCNISLIVSHKFIAGMPFIRNLASSDLISASVLLWDTDVCFLQAHEIDSRNNYYMQSVFFSAIN